MFLILLKFGTAEELNKLIFQEKFGHPILSVSHDNKLLIILLKAGLHGKKFKFKKKSVDLIIKK